MKKILVLFLILIMSFASAFADEIIDSRGNITPCKVVTVADGLIEYQKDGNLYTIKRIMNQSVFNDYVDVRTDLRHPFKKITRYSGIVISRDFAGVRIQTSHEDLQIPWFKIKFIGIYNPN